MITTKRKAGRPPSSASDGKMLTINVSLSRRHIDILDATTRNMPGASRSGVLRMLIDDALDRATKGK